MHVLVVNAGSSSLKLRVLDDAGEVVAADDRASLDAFLDAAPPIDAVGHRVVHGGSRFTTSVVVDDAVVAALEDLTDLAPLHQPPAIAGIRTARSRLPGLPNVACFDTAFHTTLPPAAHEYAVPASWRQQWGLRRYGFHGLSHAYASRRAAELVGAAAADLRTVTCHLGAGASLCAVHRGRSVDTTMGFTPTDGIVMATRPGSLDPGMLLWVQQQGGLTTQEVEDQITHDAGLLGLTGRTADMPEVIASADAGDERAGVALAVYVHRLRAGIASMAAAMGGVDLVVFTGGVGERSPRIRQEACDGLGFLGIEVDPSRNDTVGDDDLLLSTAVAVVHAREDVEVAGEVRRLVG